LRAERHARAAERLAERLRKLVDPSADLLAAQERSYNKVYDSASGRRMAPLPVSPQREQQQLHFQRARLKRRSLRSEDDYDGEGAAGGTASEGGNGSSTAHSPSRSHVSSMKNLRFAAAASGPPLADSEESDGDIDDKAGDESEATATAAAAMMSQQQRRRWKRSSATSEATSISSVQSLLHIVPAVAADTGTLAHANAAAGAARNEPASVTLARNGILAGSLNSAALPFDHFHVSSGVLLPRPDAGVSARRRMPKHVRKLSRQLRMQQQREAALDALRRRRQRRVTGRQDPFDDSSAGEGFGVRDPDPAAFEGSGHHHTDSAWDSALTAGNGSDSDDDEDIRRKHRQQRFKSFEAPLPQQMQQQKLQQQHQPPFDNDVSAGSSRMLMVRAVRVNKPPVFLTEIETEPAPFVATAPAMAPSSSAQALIVATIRASQQAPAASTAPQPHVASLPPLLSSMSVPGLVNGRGEGGLSRSLSLNTFARVQSMRALQAAQLADLGSLRARHNMQRALRQEERAQRMALYVGSAPKHVQPAAAVSAAFGTRRFGPLAPAAVLARDSSGRLIVAERPAVATATEALMVQGSQTARVSSHTANIASSRSEGQLPLLVAPLTQRERLNPRLAAMTEAAVPLERITAPAWSSPHHAKRFAADKASHIGMGQQHAQAEASGTDHDGDDDDDDNASSRTLELAARRRMAQQHQRRLQQQQQRAAVGAEVAKLLIVSNSASLPSLHVQQQHQQHPRQVQLQPSLFAPPLLPRSHSEQQLLRFPPLSVSSASASASVAVIGLPLSVSTAHTTAHHVRRGYTQSHHIGAHLEHPPQPTHLQLWGGGAASARERPLYDHYSSSPLNGASLSSRRPLLHLQPHQLQQRHQLRHRPRGFWEAAAPQRLQPPIALDNFDLPFF
jgi:hypothetical protein